MIENVTIEIRYADVMEQLRKLSSFEGREAVDATGKSIYPELHITDQDVPLLTDYAKQGAGELVAMLGSVVTENSSLTESIEITMQQHDCLKFSRKMMMQLCMEAISAYAMGKWMLLHKETDRTEFYNGLFADMVEACKRLYTVVLPTKHRRKRIDYSSEVEIVEDN